MENEICSSDSEEEILVYAEFADSVNIDNYRSIHVLGLHQKNPIIQMDDTFFRGTHDNSLGTYMFFEEDLLTQNKDPIFQKTVSKNLKYLCKTRKHLSMENAFVTPKEPTDQLDLQNLVQTDESDIEIPEFESIQEALEKFKNEWNKNIEEENRKKDKE